MPSLREIQEDFARGVLGSNHVIATQLLGAGGQSGEAGLAIYRNNVLANYRKALRETYPVVLQLIGEDCFNQAANAYARATPSISGDLYDFGAGFGEFLTDLPATRGLAYLPDVARLEWTVDTSDRAPEAGPLDLARLAAVPEVRLADLRLVLHPSARLVASPYPVLKIWQVNQSGYEGDQAVSLGSGGVWLLVMRRNLAVAIEPLSAAEFVLLATLAEARTLGHALEQALALDEVFDPGPFLQRRMLAGTFVDFALSEEEEK